MLVDFGSLKTTETLLGIETSQLMVTVGKLVSLKTTETLLGIETINNIETGDLLSVSKLLKPF